LPTNPPISLREPSVYPPGCDAFACIRQKTTGFDHSRSLVAAVLTLRSRRRSRPIRSGRAAAPCAGCAFTGRGTTRSRRPRDRSISVAQGSPSHGAGLPNPPGLEEYGRRAAGPRHRGDRNVGERECHHGCLGPVGESTDDGQTRRNQGPLQEVAIAGSALAVCGRCAQAEAWGADETAAPSPVSIAAMPGNRRAG
jgi:hypothetical protein